VLLRFSVRQPKPDHILFNSSMPQTSWNFNIISGGEVAELIISLACYQKLVTIADHIPSASGSKLKPSGKRVNERIHGMVLRKPP